MKLKLLLMTLLISQMVLRALADEPLSKKFFSEGYGVIVTQVDVSRVNQAKILGFFPNAHAYVHRKLMPGGQSQTAGPAGMVWSDRDFSTVLKLESNWKSGRATPGWSYSFENLSQFLGKLSLFTAENFYPTDPAGLTSKYLDPTDTENGTAYVHLAPREQSGLSSGTATYNFTVPVTSGLVEFVPMEKMPERLASIETGSRLARDPSQDDIDDAWKIGAGFYRQHYETYQVSIHQTYEGPDREEPRKKLGDFVLSVHRGTNTNKAAVLVLPVLEAPDVDGELSPPVKAAFEPVAAAAFELTDSVKVSKVVFPASTLLKQALAPALIRNGDADARLDCLPNSPENFPSGACDGNSGGVGERILLRRAPNDPVGTVTGAFYVTDHNRSRIWLIEMKVEGPAAPNLKGEYAPLTDLRANK